MSVEFPVRTTSRFDRELKKLVAHHPELPEHCVAALKQDPVATGISSRNYWACRPMTASTGFGRIAFDSATTSRASLYI